MDQQDHAIDIAELAQELREEALRASVTSSSSRAPLAGGGSPPSIVIGKVGELTRNVDPAEYDPQFVSVGPYHRTSNPRLARDADKVRSLNAVLSAASAGGVTLDAFLVGLSCLEGRARGCYEHAFAMSRKEFVRMLLLDGCYILSRFCGGGAPATNGYRGAARVMAAGGGVGVDRHEAIAVVRDVLYLAENQIPFFVIEKIHELAFPDAGVTAVAGVARYVEELLRRQHYSVAPPAMVNPSTPGNLLHLIHMHFKPTMISPATHGRGATGKPARRWRTATEYYSAGVRFKARAIAPKGDVRSIVDVRVSRRGGALEIPHLHIDGETWRLLRNLIALEQLNYSAAAAAEGPHVTAYCVFVSQLACTARDVELLARRGVVAHGLGNHDEVAEFFADLCKGALFDADDHRCNYLRPVLQLLEARFRSRPRRWAALLWQKYLGNPWLVLGLTAAAVGLACTVVQAVYAVLSYKQSTNN